MLMYSSFFGSSYFSNCAIFEKMGGKTRKIADTHRERARSLRMYTEPWNVPYNSINRTIHVPYAVQSSYTQFDSSIQNYTKQKFIYLKLKNVQLIKLQIWRTYKEKIRIERFLKIMPCIEIQAYRMLLCLMIIVIQANRMLLYLITFMYCTSI